MNYYYYKLITDGKIIRVGSQSFPVEETDGFVAITQEEYDSLIAEIKEHANAVQSYVEQIQKGKISIDDVPEEYYTEVKKIVESQPEPKYTLDEAADIIVQEVSRK